MAKPYGGRPQGWKAEHHCAPQKGDRIVSPHVFTPVAPPHQEWDESGLNLTETSLVACRCGVSRAEVRTYNYGIELALIEHGLGNSVTVHYLDDADDDESVLGTNRRRTDCCSVWRTDNEVVVAYDAAGVPDVVVCRTGMGCLA